MPSQGGPAAGDAATAGVLGGRYRLDELIGRGGMAAVWRATDIEFDRTVAVKRLHPRHVDDAEFAERFRREARVVARLSHPNLVRMLDAGEDESGPYLVLELVEGETLKQRLARERSLSPAEAVRVVAKIADALDYAHGQGVVHRDIKSQNVLLSADGTAKLADFGIARLLEADAEASLTQTDMMVGSADYVAPEQAEGGAIDARTDVYSLGVVLYEVLVGELPFRGDGFVAVALKHVSEPLPDPRSYAADVPDDLAAVVLRAAAKDPDARFATAGALAAALRGEAGGTALQPLVPGGSDTTARAKRPRRPRRPRRLIALAAAAAALLVLVVAFVTVGPLGGDGVGSEDLTPLTIAAVADYDPEGNDGSERPDLVDFALDSPGEWTTERYSSADFGNLKSGVGLRLSLDGPSDVRELTVSSGTPGVRFSVLGPEDSTGARTPIGGGTTSGRPQVVALRPIAPVDELVLWFTELVAGEDGRYSASVEKVSVQGVANPSG